MTLRFLPRILPILMALFSLLAFAKAEAIWRTASKIGHSGVAMEAPIISSARASSAPTAPPASVPPPSEQIPSPVSPDPTEVAERAVLESLRARRLGLENRESALSAREQVLAAAEKRLTARLEEMEQLQRRLVTESDAKKQQDEAGWRGLVKVYEAMKPRDAAAIFDDLDMSVLAQIVARMKEAKASPVIGAMRPERARELTTELARLRAGIPG